MLNGFSPSQTQNARPANTLRSMMTLRMSAGQSVRTSVAEPHLAQPGWSDCLSDLLPILQEAVLVHKPVQPALTAAAPAAALA